MNFEHRLRIHRRRRLAGAIDAQGYRHVPRYPDRRRLGYDDFDNPTLMHDSVEAQNAITRKHWDDLSARLSQLDRQLPRRVCLGGGDFVTVPAGSILGPMPIPHGDGYADIELCAGVWAAVPVHQLDHGMEGG